MKYHFSRGLRDDDKQHLLAALDCFDIVAYFETSNGKKKLFGFGVKEQSQSPKELKGDIVFGGYAFDDQVIANSKLMNGFWFIPSIFVAINDGKIRFESDEISDFDQWLMQFLFSKQKAVTIRRTFEEKDWQSRTRDLINKLNNDAVLEKVVFGRQQQYALSEKIKMSYLIQKMASQDNTYHVILKRHAEIFISATPERLVKITGGNLKTAAVAGTIRRGKTVHEDKKFGEYLLNSVKNKREHQYVVNNIFQKLQGMTTNLNIPKQPILLKNKQMQHLYTPVTADVNTAYSIVDIVQRLHPTPALGGVPQIQALEYIQTHEQSPRGLFAAPIGYYTADNSGEFVVGIRSMYINQMVNTATLFAGAGIVSDSDATQEFQETSLKFKPMRQLLKGYTYDD